MSWLNKFCLYIQRNTWEKLWKILCQDVETIYVTIAADILMDGFDKEAKNARKF